MTDLVEPTGLLARLRIPDWISEDNARELIDSIEDTAHTPILAAIIPVHPEMTAESLLMNNGGLQIQSGARPEALLTLVGSVGDLEKCLALAARVLPTLIDNLSGMEVRRRRTLINNLVEAAETTVGACQVVVDGPDPFELVIKFAGLLRMEPDLVVDLDRAGLVELWEGRISAREAVARGMVRFEGDLSLVMRIAPLLY